MIKASATSQVPWGYVCGFPIRHGGDLYGGAMYLQSSTVEGRAATPQGRAIRDASQRFGDGKTLPFPPCKRGYIPMVDGKKMYGCHIHSDNRKKRVEANGGVFRLGEKQLSDFWLGEKGNLGSNKLVKSKVPPKDPQHEQKKAAGKNEESSDLSKPIPKKRRQNESVLQTKKSALVPKPESGWLVHESSRAENGKRKR
uniref:Uncharacterized protein n=1 Tax=Pseudictyota dubia TaxID=2749911 RepID=A0A7R9ZCT4_9STRA|mmetsp:Transcript_38816/g.71725  ORF Transcript_38816/g.71725 Transcript_38816/m.71725 type:complete len:198 (+) Transcript_38816:195-788(+)